MKLVSIILPVYNCSEYIREAISSLLIQTHTNFELIIIDDCSTDSTPEIVKSFTDRRISFFKNKTNRGVTITLNSALQYCKGSLIARMDGDDIAHFERIEKQVDFFERNPNIGLISCRYLVKDSLLGKTHLVSRHLDDARIRFHMLFRNQFIHPGIMIQSKLLKKLRYRDVPTCEDYDLWTRALKHCQVANCQEILMVYRWHGKNISIAEQPKMRKSMLAIISRMLTDYNVEHSPQELLLQVMIALGFSKDQLSYLHKIDAMKSWLEKLSVHTSLKNHFGETFLKVEIMEYKKLYEFI